MKYMIVSDIHGDADCTDKIIDIFNSKSCDALIILGDILYHGPRNDLPAGYAPKRVIKSLNSMKDRIIAIKGNCDAEVDQMVLDFNINSDPYELELNGRRVMLTHGHKFEIDSISATDFDLVFYGHTHLLRAERLESGITVINPGSTSIPKGGNKNSFAICEEDKITVYDLDCNEIISVII